MARAKVAATPIHRKRTLSSSATPLVTTPSNRSSKRLKQLEEKASANGKATPKKSKYFEGSESEAADGEPETSDADSGYEESAASETEASLSADSGEWDSEEDAGAQKRRSRKPTTSRSSDVTPKVENKNTELWRPGVKTGLGPGKQVFIEKPKAKGDGGVKYAPEKIHPNTMAFLADLKKNNDREWFKMHDPDYRQSWNDWISFVETLTERISEVDETIPELPPKDLVFRIYRDIRFTPDPTPYKPHFSAAWSRTGRKGPYACYYVQIMPGGNNLVISGLWQPESGPLALLRNDIDRHPDRIKNILMNAGIRKSVFGGIANDEKKAVKAFTSYNSESALKTKPKVC